MIKIPIIIISILLILWFISVELRIRDNCEYNKDQTKINDSVGKTLKHLRKILRAKSEWWMKVERKHAWKK